MDNFVALPCPCLDGVMEINSIIRTDPRGCLYETFRRDELETEFGVSFPTTKISVSKKNVLRGLHYSDNSAKITRVLNGMTYHVAVDMREGSKTYLQWHAWIMKSEEGRAIYLPSGYALGFYTLTDNVITEYFTSNYYENYNEQVVKWNDPRLKIHWPAFETPLPLMSDKDR